MKDTHADVVAGIILCLLAWFLNGQLAGLPWEGTLLPQAVLICLVACGVLLAINAVARKESGIVSFLGELSARRFFQVVTIFLVSVICCLYVSYLATLFLMCFTVTSLLTENMSGRKLLVNLGFSVSTVIVIYLFFTKLMHVYFPEPFLS